VKDLAGPSLALTAPTINAAWEGRVEAVIDTKSRLKAVFIGRDDLTASKLVRAGCATLPTWRKFGRRANEDG